MKNSVGIIPVFVSHMGCPNDCVFCNQRKISGVTDAILPSDLEVFVTNYLETMKRDQIELAFFGGSFTGIECALQESYLSIAYQLKMHGKIDKIRLSTRPDYIDDSVMSRLIKYSVDLVELGCQSFDEQVLLASKRGHTGYIVEGAVKKLKASGIEVGIQLMLGLPEDSFIKFQNSVIQAIHLSPSCVRLYPALVIKDTELEEIYIEGAYSPLDIESAIKWCAWAYETFQNHHIPVIRMGLQRTDLIDFDQAVLAGPFHPAFGELVLSRVFLNHVKLWFNENNFKIDETTKIRIVTHPSQLSMMIGQKRSNMIYLIEMLSLKSSQMVCKTDLLVETNQVWIFIDDVKTIITIMN